MIKKAFYFLIIASLLTSCSQQQPITIVFTGDVMLDRGISDQLQLHGDSLLIKSFSLFNKPDFLAINLESTLTNSKTIQADRYNFKADEKNAALLKAAGVTHASVANNHSFDFGETGYQNTITALQGHNINPLGHTSEPVIIKKGNIKCAVLATSLSSHNNALPIRSIKELKSAIIAFKKKSAHLPFVLYIHWGLELQPEPEAWQRELANDLTLMGVDAIIGHHPHVTQTIEYINNIPVFYSLGNFVADGYLPGTDQSYAVEIVIDQKINKIHLIPTQLNHYFPQLLDADKQLTILKKHLAYSSIGLLKQGHKWLIKPIKEVNFSEHTSLWVMAQDNTISYIKKLKENSYLLSFEKDEIKANVLNLHGSLSEFEVADINNDHQTDVLLGISKKVKFDPKIKKRINIYTFRNKSLEALWLGTKFIHDIASFNVIQYDHLNFLKTKEISDKGEEIERIYEWDDFGFALTHLNDK